MKTRHVWIGAAAIALAVGGNAAAQAPGASSESEQQKPSTITVTGCLRSADQAGGAAGAGAPGAKSSASPDRFVLANATPSGGAGAAKSDSPASAGAGATYELQGKAGELKPHLNHQIEVSGRLDSPSGSEKGAAGQRLQVESVKMLSATCSK